jgi:hypothetical protein
MWSPALSSSVPMTPRCCSSSPLGYLSWTHPLSSTASVSDLDLASWAFLCLLQVFILALHHPPCPWTSLDAWLESSSHCANL